MSASHHPNASPAPPPANSPGLVIGGMHGSSGKTVLTCLLLAAWGARGLAVQPFKAGPDYIDPGFHNRFASRPSVNLDTWLMGGEAVPREAASRTRNASGLLEGVLGLFDGSNPVSEEGSTMELARRLEWPVLLSVPAAKAGRSLAASLRGFLQEAHPHRIAGVVLNGVSGDSHRDYLHEALRPLGVPILGAIPQLEALSWPERHLGLQAASEQALPDPAFLADLARRHLDLDAILSLCQVHPASGPQDSPSGAPPKTPGAAEAHALTRPRRRVAIARDEAFHFYYATNLEWLARQHVELVEFSPLRSENLPSGAHAVLLGGGFPEVFAAPLARNPSLLRALKSAACDGVPIYAECGGLMLLAGELHTLEGERFPMAGVLPGVVEMTPSLQNFGYCSARLPVESTPCGQGEHPDHAEARLLHGHEFHHSRWTREGDLANRWSVTRRRTGLARTEGFQFRAVHASYVHLDFSANAPTLREILHLTP